MAQKKQLSEAAMQRAQKKEERREKINQLIKQEEEGALIFNKQSAFSFFFMMVLLPSLAGVIPRRGLVRSRITIMPCAEALPALRVILLDLHVRITEANLDHRPLRIPHIHSLLLRLSGRVERLVQRHLLALVLSHISFSK